jgi:hypothetical protein
LIQLLPEVGSFLLRKMPVRLLFDHLIFTWRVGSARRFKYRTQLRPPLVGCCLTCNRFAAERSLLPPSQYRYRDQQKRPGTLHGTKITSNRVPQYFFRKKACLSGQHL